MDPEHLRDDLRSEVALILLEKPDEVIKDLDAKKNLRFYTARIIMNLMFSNTSPFYNRYRLHGTNIIPEDLRESDPNGRYHKELMEDRAIEHIEKLYWYDKEIVNLYLKLGNYRAIEKDTGIPWESCYSTIRKVIKQIRDELKPV
jgi:hypothetical protein